MTLNPVVMLEVKSLRRNLGKRLTDGTKNEVYERRRKSYIEGAAVQETP